MRVSVDDAGLIDDLARYLVRCGCEVRHEGARILRVDVSNDVSIDAALALVRDGRCYACSEPVAVSLASMGSPLCHDCRDGGRADVSAAEAWSRMEVDAFLGVWRKWHPQASVVTLGRPLARAGRSAA